MGLYDRDYVQDNYQNRFQNAPQMQFRFPKITPAVKWLLIINFAVFFIGIIFFPSNITVPGFPPEFKINLLEKHFSVFPITFGNSIQIWRFITYQFLHSQRDAWHIFFNMLGLFFLGPTLERFWGTKKFVIFYLCCGIAGALFYTILVWIGFLGAGPMVGASGSILGLLAACAILFPHFVVFIMLFPVPIRIAAIGLSIIFLAIVISKGPNAGGEAAHLAGMAAGAVYVLSTPVRKRLSMRIKSKQWESKAMNEQKIQQEVDRILEKVHNEGIQSLTHSEKKILKKATNLEQTRHKF